MWIALLSHCAREFETSYLRTWTECCIVSCLFGFLMSFRQTRVCVFLEKIL